MRTQQHFRGQRGQSGQGVLVLKVSTESLENHFWACDHVNQRTFNLIIIIIITHMDENNSDDLKEFYVNMNVNINCFHPSFTCPALL